MGNFKLIANQGDIYTTCQKIPGNRSKVVQPSSRDLGLTKTVKALDFCAFDLVVHHRLKGSGAEESRVSADDVLVVFATILQKVHGVVAGHEVLLHITNEMKQMW